VRKVEVNALGPVDVDIEKGSFWVVKGPSGSGKTTLLMCLGGMLQPDKGQVSVFGYDLYGSDERSRTRFRASNIGFVFQMFHLIPYLSVYENIRINNQAVNGIKIGEERIREIAKDLNFAHRLKHYPSELSAGEKQRVALARALIKKPGLILADEPTGNLDPENGREVLNHLKLFRDQGGTVVMVTHDDAADDLATHVLYLKNGLINKIMSKSEKR
jgi:ABC-type lipoprotein export system ATPase subunit